MLLEFNVSIVFWCYFVLVLLDFVLIYLLFYLILFCLCVIFCYWECILLVEMELEVVLGWKNVLVWFSLKSFILYLGVEGLEWVLILEFELKIVFIIIFGFLLLFILVLVCEILSLGVFG